MTEWIGYAAATGTTLAFLPQLVRVWTRRSADDISLGMYVLIVTGISLWIVYGVRIHSNPVIVANSVTLLLAIGVLVGKLRFGRRRP